MTRAAALPPREKARQEEAERLDAEILHAISSGWSDLIDASRFDRLARDVFAHQFRFNPVYRQFCALHGVSAPGDVAGWKQIPPVPTGAFKVGRWATFPEQREAAAFSTFGTIQGTPGVHRFDTLALYNAAIISSGRRFLFPDLDRVRCLFLSPSPADAPDSSLVHMFAVFREAFGDPRSSFFLRGPPLGGLRLEDLFSALDDAEQEGESVLIAGAALAFHHALGALGSEPRRLPLGSRTMVTGGFKGALRETDANAIGSAIEAQLGVSIDHQVEEYGMTELSTQYYDERLRTAVVDDGGRPRAGFRVPPWARVMVIDPGTGAELGPGAVGALVHFDLANRASAIAIQTSDVGERTADGGILLRGREPEAEARGCSLAAELWLGQG
ncbi:MAG: hypothetical protein KAI97_03960 [Gemmatimonadetes bacterium]|nr:hypothetical protein [Gemmatimonadota bacterium]